MMMALGQFVFGMDTLAFQDLDRQARLRVARVAGHARLRSAGAYIGAIRRSPAGSRGPAQDETGKPGPGSIGDDGDTPVPVA